MPNIRMRLLAPTNMPTLQIKSWIENWETRVYSSTQAKKVKKNGEGTIATTSDETKEFNCVEWRPYNYVLSSID